MIVVVVVVVVILVTVVVGACDVAKLLERSKVARAVTVPS